MGNKNQYAMKVQARNQAMLDVGTEYGQQKIIDMLVLALNDPDVMGRDTFGRERVKKVVLAIQEYAQAFAKAYAVDPESDYWQEKLDQRLLQIVGEDNFAPFPERYPYVKMCKY